MTSSEGNEDRQSKGTVLIHSQGEDGYDKAVQVLITTTEVLQ